MVFVGKLILALFIGVILIVYWRPKPDMVIKIENGKPKVKRGNVSRLFLQDCERICTDFNIQKGKITGKKKSGVVSLKFSGGIAKKYHQQFRNTWNFHR
jgi:hypothetical protein